MCCPQIDFPTVHFPSQVQRSTVSSVTRSMGTSGTAKTSSDPRTRLSTSSRATVRSAICASRPSTASRSREQKVSPVKTKQSNNMKARVSDRHSCFRGGHLYCHHQVPTGKGQITVQKLVTFDCGQVAFWVRVSSLPDSYSEGIRDDHNKTFSVVVLPDFWCAAVTPPPTTKIL